MKRFLMVENDFVYPPNHGGRVDAWNRILAINEMNGYIHLICTVKENPRKEFIDVVNKYVGKLTLVFRKNSVFDMLYKRPLQMVSRRKIKNIQLEEEYDYLILEGSYVLDILENKTLKVKHKILRMHNDEKVYFKGLGKASSSLVRKIYYFWEAYKFKCVDKDIMEKIPNVMFISHDEMVRYLSKYPWVNGCFLPTAVSLNFKQRKLKNNIVLMIGSLFMVNNQEGIMYYIQNVHYLLKDVPDYKLVIAGNSRGQNIDWLKSIAKNWNNIDIYDSPEDLEMLYDNASIFVNSMINGAGVKLKTVNAIIQGLPVVTTTVGNEGTGPVPERDVLVADDPLKISACIRKLLQDKAMAQELVGRAQKYLEENYNQKETLRTYLNGLDR